MALISFTELVTSCCPEITAFHFLCSFVRKLLVDWFFILFFFFLQKSLASIGWLLLLFLFIFFDQVGGWSSCSFSKALVVGVDCLRCMDNH